jgi:hypothetical protein
LTLSSQLGLPLIKLKPQAKKRWQQHLTNIENTAGYPTRKNLYTVDQASNSRWTVLEVGKVKSSEVLSRKAFSGNDHQKKKRKSLRNCGKKTDCLTVDPPEEVVPQPLM